MEEKDLGHVMVGDGYRDLRVGLDLSDDNHLVTFIRNVLIERERKREHR